MEQHGRAEEHQSKRKKYRRSISPDYCPMEVPDHIYVDGIPRQPVKPEMMPEMVVPSRITVAGGDSTVASKAQPVEVLRERQSLLHSSDSENISMNGTPQMLTANELPQEDVTFAVQKNEPTSIAVDKDPLNELKVMRRRLNRLANRVTHLEVQSEEHKNEATYLLGVVSISTLLTVALLASQVRMWLNN
uniref:Mitochondrial fission factor n=1 Tax=Globodera rostochiensis TaxID=31243 RepID=A0A914HHX6_GLORO